MLKHRNRLIGAAGAVVTAATIAVSGVMAASAAPAGPRAAVSGTENFQIMTTSPTSTTAKVIASGVFTKPGVDHTGNTVDKLVFSNGTIKVRHSAGTGSQTFDPKTCLFTANLHGTYKVLSGTGKYAGISGSGKYTASILGIGAKSNGKCSRTKAPVALQQVIRASGPVKF